MNITLEDIDWNFHESILRLADRCADQLPKGAEQPEGTWRTVTTDRYYEAINEAILSVEAETPAEMADDERLNQMDRAA